jgi:hypothetical protein
MAARQIPPWVRVANGLWLDPKLRRCSVEARYLFVIGLGYSADAGLDGKVPIDMLPVLAADIPGGHETPTAQLIANDVWVKRDRENVGVPERRWERWQTPDADRRDQREKERIRSADRRAKQKAELEAARNGHPTEETP